MAAVTAGSVVVKPSEISTPHLDFIARFRLVLKLLF